MVWVVVEEVKVEVDVDVVVVIVVDVRVLVIVVLVPGNTVQLSERVKDWTPVPV